MALTESDLSERLATLNAGKTSDAPSAAPYTIEAGTPRMLRRGSPHEAGF